MKRNKFKERLILFGGTIGIGAISLAITLTVYNIQISKNPKVDYKDETKIVYNDGLTEAQRVVAENLIAELNKLEVEADNKKDENVNDNPSNETSTSDINQEDEGTEEVTKNDIEIETEIVETFAKADKKISFIKPVEGDIGMIFSDEKLVYSKTLNEWLTHKALDILAEEGTDVKVSADGTVKDIYEDTKYGFTIVVEHDNGYVTKYSGVKEDNSLKIGMNLKQGDVISQISEACGFEIGEGSHLHFEALKDGVNIEPEFI